MYSKYNLMFYYNINIINNIIYYKYISRIFLHVEYQNNLK